MRLVPVTDADALPDTLYMKATVDEDGDFEILASKNRDFTNSQKLMYFTVVDGKVRGIRYCEPEGLDDLVHLDDSGKLHVM